MTRIKIIKKPKQREEKKKKSVSKKLTHKEIVGMLVKRAYKIKGSKEVFLKKVLEEMINTGFGSPRTTIGPRFARIYLGIMLWETAEKERAIEWIASADAFYEATKIISKNNEFTKKMAEEANKHGEFLQSAEIINQESYPLNLKDKEKYIKKMSVKAFKKNKRKQFPGFNLLLSELRKKEK